MAERDRPVKDLRVYLRTGTRVPVDGGFAVDQEFGVAGTILDPDVGPIEVEIDVEVVSGRALARSVKVSSADEVSSTVLRKVAIRELIAWGLRPVLKRVNLTDGGLEPIVGEGGTGVDDAALAAIKRLVTYMDDETAGREDIEYAEVQP